MSLPRTVAVVITSLVALELESLGVETGTQLELACSPFLGPVIMGVTCSLIQ